MSEHFKKTLSKIEQKTAKIGVIGLGYVGLPIVLRFCEEGYQVTGFDVDRSKVDALNSGGSYIKHIPAEKVSSFVKARAFSATTDTSSLSKMDAVIICVPTPLSDKREPDLSHVRSAAEEAAKYQRRGQLISLESTTYPGTTEEMLLPLLTQGGMKAGKDFFLVFSPEREDPGRADYTTRNTPKIIGGITEKCTRLGAALYSKIIHEIVPVSSTKVAEMSKLLENIYRSVNIALVNELKMLCDRMKIDIWEVIEASNTKPFGFQAFYPGPGLGGHCIPIDPFYLTWKAREFDFSTRFIELAGEINMNMPYYIVTKVMEALNSNGMSVKGSNILILGLAYKKNVDDLRESPSLELIKILKLKGAKVAYNDPYVPLAVHHKNGTKMRSVPLSLKGMKKYDCVIVATDHSTYDYRWIASNSKLVVDTRNAMAGIKSANVVKA